jgi:PhnB protein
MAITPHLVVGGAAKAIDFYKAAFDAEEVLRMPAEDGQRLMHAHLKIGGSDLFLVDDFPEYCGGASRDPLKLNGVAVTFHQYVPDADAAIAKAAAAGAKVTMPAQDMFWGDRYGQIVDPFGHTWSFAHKLAK